MCASDDYIPGVTDEERRSIEADPVLVEWLRKEKSGYDFESDPLTYEWRKGIARDRAESRVLNVIVLVLICFGVTCFFAVLALR